MNYTEAPNEYTDEAPYVFLAGGISDTENWQSQFLRRVSDQDITILNPRREHFPAGDLKEEKRQIEWEHRYLTKAALVAFWFPPQTVCPIALYELGACCSVGVPLVVGADPDYSRRFDLKVQLELRRPEVKLHDSVDSVAKEVIRHDAISGTLQ